ncbi:hypothetical protein Tco_1229228 [Tanacetum coccineum]
MMVLTWRRVSSSNMREKPDGNEVKLVRGGAEVSALTVRQYTMHASAIGQLTKGKNDEGKEIARLVVAALEKDYKQSSPNKVEFAYMLDVDSLGFSVKVYDISWVILTTLWNLVQVIRCGRKRDLRHAAK